MTCSGNDVEVRTLEATEAVETSECPICEHEEATPTFGIAGHPFEIVVCSGCGVGRFAPRPKPEEIASFYPSSYYGEQGNKFAPAIEHFVRSLASRKARQLSHDLPAGARILDVGCGRGTLLGDLADLGFEVHGIEVSEDAARGADARADIRIAWTLSDAGYPIDYFDHVILWHVLEHLHDPMSTLLDTHRILRPGGRLSLAVPNFSSAQARWSSAAWFHLDPPRHLFHFPLPTLQTMLSDRGFETISVSHFSLRQNPFGWVQSLLNLSETMPRNALYSTLQDDRSTRISPRQRAACLAAFALGMPIGLALSALATLLRSGATVSLEARRRA